MEKDVFNAKVKDILEGRVVCEILFIDEELSKLIGKDSPLSVIYEKAKQKGFKNLREDAKEKVLAGITTPEEIKRVVG